MPEPPNELQWLLRDQLKRVDQDIAWLRRELCMRGIELSHRSVRRLIAARNPAISLVLLSALTRIFRCSITRLIGVPRAAAGKAAVPAPVISTAPEQRAIAKPSSDAPIAPKRAKPPTQKLAKQLFPVEVAPKSLPSAEGPRLVHSREHRS